MSEETTTPVTSVANDTTGVSGVTSGEVRVLTFGEKAVGLTFNPSNDPSVQVIKERFASAIDCLNILREVTENPEVKRMLSVAITEAQTAQMWGVKAVTWR